MLSALSKAGFHTRTRWSEEARQAVTIRRLEQILFISPQQIQLCQRLSSDFLLESDATFGNNQLRMPLVGITNTNQTFSAGFSFIQTEKL